MIWVSGQKWNGITCWSESFSWYIAHFYPCWKSRILLHLVHRWIKGPAAWIISYLSAGFFFFKLASQKHKIIILLWTTDQGHSPSRQHLGFYLLSLFIYFPAYIFSQSFFFWTVASCCSSSPVTARVVSCAPWNILIISYDVFHFHYPALRGSRSICSSFV